MHRSLAGGLVHIYKRLHGSLISESAHPRLPHLFYPLLRFRTDSRHDFSVEGFLCTCKLLRKMIMFPPNLPRTAPRIRAVQGWIVGEVQKGPEDLSSKHLENALCMEVPEQAQDSEGIQLNRWVQLERSFPPCGRRSSLRARPRKACRE